MHILFPMQKPNVKDDYGLYFSKKFSGIGTGVIILLIGIAWLLKDLGYIPSSVSVWAIFFIVIGIWWILSKVF